MSTEAVAVLRGDFPAIDPEPSTAGQNYTIENFKRLEEWHAKYGTPCLLVTLGLVERPVYSMDGTGAANALAVVPMSQLVRYRSQIATGAVMWAPLRAAVDMLRRPVRSEGQADVYMAAMERSNKVLTRRLEKQLEAARNVEEALRWDEWAQLNPDKVVGD